MADGFEKAFQAFVQSHQDDSDDPYLDENNNTDEEDSLDDESHHIGRESGKDKRKKKLMTQKLTDRHKLNSKQKPIPKLKLMVDPDYVPNENLSPFSLKRYIKSPNSHVVKLESYSNSVHAASISKQNSYHQTAVMEAEIKKRLGTDVDLPSASSSTKRVLFPRKMLKGLRKTGICSPVFRHKCTYRKQIVLKKYGLQYPGRKRKDNHNLVTIIEPVEKSFSKDINFNPLLNKDSVHGNGVSKTECDSHFFCAQGEGLSRNSPEAAKSVISSPANASVGENSLTDSSVSPMYDPITSTVSTITSSELLFSGDTETQHTVTRTNNISLQENKETKPNESHLLECGICALKCTCQISFELPNDRIKKSRRYTVSAEKETDFTEIVSHHFSNKFGNKNKSSSKHNKNSNKRKRNYSENQINVDPDFVLDDTEEESVNDYRKERKKRSRPRRNSSCLCCSSKAPKHVRRQSLKCNISDFKYLSIVDQNFIRYSVQLSNIKSKLHSLFCSVFPKLVPILHNITPESHQFHQIIEDMLQTLQASNDEELQNDTISVVSLLEDMNLKNDTKFVPIFDFSIRLCQNPKQCLDSFRDKVVSLLQLLLPDLIISLDSFLSSTTELEKFLDKVILSNCVK